MIEGFKRKGEKFWDLEGDRRGAGCKLLTLVCREKTRKVGGTQYLSIYDVLFFEHLPEDIST